MARLRSKLIRLAHQKPELRPHLLPLLRSGADTETLEVKLEGNSDLIKRMKLLLQAIQALGSWGASRYVYIGIDGDGADRLTVHGLPKMDKALSDNLHDATEHDVVGIGEEDFYGRRCK